MQISAAAADEESESGQGDHAGGGRLRHGGGAVEVKFSIAHLTSRKTTLISSNPEGVPVKTACTPEGLPAPAGFVSG
jgi:hypothetical protein